MTAAYYDDPSFLYGNASRKYDEVPSGFDANRLYWRFEVAWISAYNYWHETTGQTETIYATDCYWNRGRDSFVASDGSGLTRMEPGRMVITLVNIDNRYDPYNSSSPLYPNVTPGKLCRLGVRLASQSSYTWRFTGMIVDVRPYRDENGEAFVELTITDGWGWLQDRVSFVPMVADRDTSVSNLFGTVLEDIDWPKMWGSSVADAALDLAWFWSGTKDVRNVLHDIAEVQSGRLYIRGDGSIVHKARTTTDTLIVSLTQTDILKDVPMNQPWENAWNYVEMTVRALTDFTDFGTIWGDIAEPPTEWDTTVTPEYVIAAGDTLTITGRFDRPRNFVFDDESTFLFGHTGADGTRVVSITSGWWTGSGETGTRRSGAVEVLSFRENGESFEAVLKNNFSAALYSSYVSVVGYGKMYIPAASLNFSADYSSGATLRPIRISKNPYMIFGGDFTMNVLQDIVNDFGSMINGVSRLPVITLDAQHSKQFLDISDRFNLSVTRLGISSDYRVGHMEERWLTPNAQAVQTRIQAEPYFVAS